MDKDNGVTEIVGDSQWGGIDGLSRDMKDELERGTGQVMVPTESQVYVRAHGLCKWGTTMIFDMIIINLDA